MKPMRSRAQESCPGTRSRAAVYNADSYIPYNLKNNHSWPSTLDFCRYFRHSFASQGTERYAWEEIESGSFFFDRQKLHYQCLSTAGKWVRIQLTLNASTTLHEWGHTPARWVAMSRRQIRFGHSGAAKAWNVERLLKPSITLLHLSLHLVINGKPPFPF